MFMMDVGGRANFEQLYAAVSGLIREGRYRPGERIRIKDLATHLRVSPTPLREVLSRLVGREIVEERRLEGYYLARLDARDVADLYRLHMVCIDLALRAGPQSFAAPSGTDVWQTFEHHVAAAGDHILANMQRFLGERLAVLRRCEIAYFAQSADDVELRNAILVAGTAGDLQSAARSFHRLRWKAAEDLALLFGRM